MSRNDEMLSSNASMVQLNVYKKQEDGIWGEILNVIYKEKPTLCFDMGDFLLKLDALYDELQFPMAYMRIRSFSKCPESGLNNRLPNIKPVAYYDNNNFNLYKQLRQGKQSYEASAIESDNFKEPIEVFFIHTICRQHASWQGEVLRKKTLQKKCFRSDLELLHLIQSALQEDKTEEEKHEDIMSRA